MRIPTFIPVVLGSISIAGAKVINVNVSMDVDYSFFMPDTLVFRRWCHWVVLTFFLLESKRKLGISLDSICKVSRA